MKHQNPLHTLRNLAFPISGISVLKWGGFLILLLFPVLAWAQDAVQRPDGSVTIHDAATGDEVASLPAHADWSKRPVHGSEDPPPRHRRLGASWGGGFGPC